MLEGSGISELRRLEHETTSLLVMTGHKISDGDTHSVAVMAKNSWTEMTEASVVEAQALMLRLNVTAGILISVGTFTAGAIVASRGATQAPLQLIDGAILANLFYQARLGLRTITWTSCYPDSAFFRNLSVE